MRKPRYEVVSGYGAWAPDPEGINRICSKVNAETSLKNSDHDPAKVQAALDSVAPKEVQEKYKLKIQEAHGFNLPPSLISEFT